MIKKVLIIGGRERGLYLVKNILDHKFPIHGFIVMEEDDHEVKYSLEIAKVLDDNNIPNVTGKSFKSNKIGDFFNSIKPDCVLVENWRTIIPNNYITGVENFIVFHESLLPRYRGFAPLAWPIINGETETGVTMFYISEGVDSGDIIDQRRIPIDPADSVNDVFYKTFEAYWDLIRKNVPLLLDAKIHPVKQDESLASYSCMRTPEDGQIFWVKKTIDIFNLVRALSPPLMPGAFFFYNDNKIVILEAEIMNNPPEYDGRIPGRIIEISKECVAVLTGDGVIRIKEVLVNNEVKRASEVLDKMKIKLK